MSINKKFKLSSDQLKELVKDGTWCVATDRVMVDGTPIGYMQRETPVAPNDSGWRFFCGDEDRRYMADNSNHGVYALNTVANYDTSVVPYLNAACGSRFDKIAGDKYELLDE